MKHETVLLVEDNLKILDANRRILAEDGIVALTAASLADARRCLQDHAPDVVVLDIMLPDGDGLEFLSELRESCDAPVLFLTAKGEKSDRLAGLRAGGNDYITKPYDIDEFLARVKAFLHLVSSRSAPQRLTLDTLELDIHANIAFDAGRDMLLTQKEFTVLLYLARRNGETVSAQTLYEAVWRAPYLDSSATVKSTVSSLRRKLEGSGWLIASVRGSGYSLSRAAEG